MAFWDFLGSSDVTLDMFLSQNNASKLLLAIMESRHDSENAERILYNMRPKELVRSFIFIFNVVIPCNFSIYTVLAGIKCYRLAPR